MIKAMLIAGGALATGVIAIVVAPAALVWLGILGLLGAAGTGTAISSLSGAALTSAASAAVTGTIVGTKLVIGLCAAVLGALGGLVRMIMK